MNYEKIYFDMMSNLKTKNRKKTKGVYEFDNHHIIPKFNNGTNDKSNLVLLTPREHFIAHKLLFKIFKNRQASAAIWRMINSQYKIIKSSREFEILKLQILKIQSKSKIGKKGTPCSEEHKTKLSNLQKERLKNKNNHPMFGKQLTNETKEKISNTQKERYKDLTLRTHRSYTQEQKDQKSKERKGKYCGSDNGMFGINHSDESKKRISEKRKSGKWMTCKGVRKFVLPLQVDSYLSLGWKFGYCLEEPNLLDNS